MSVTDAPVRPGEGPVAGSSESAEGSALVLAGDPRVVALATPTWRAGVVPGAAASLAYAQVLVDGVWRDLVRPTGASKLDAPTSCASFPLVPWSNRVAGARLTWGGRSWRLPRTSPDGTAMHGAVLPFAFDVVERTGTSVRMTFDSRDAVGVGFPWAFRTEITYALDERGLSVTTTVENVDAEPFPAGFGHHPYFVRHLVPDTEDALLEVPVTRGYRLVDAIATEEAGDVPARADYRTLRPLGDRFVDDCLTGRVPGVPARIVYPGARADGSDVEVRIHADDVYAHWVVYVPVRRTYFAVEPATNANGGFALADRGVPGSGVFVLEPGESRSGTFSIEL
ncbi:aldose 1-epimerase [Flavimobilis soli]|uniref:Aldose 1-epimerase n=1 Tax=Flavimobilis soli TaxID=442709 RepID=A0A2A9EFM5_9MICO|nr:aldose 1-epimerase [Flavimobilis soli]